jgi:hypothetical protein
LKDKKLKIDNIKLLTEYERQFKRKYPGLGCKLITMHDSCRLDFDVLADGTIYSFALTTAEVKNGDYPCTLYYWYDQKKKDKITDFHFTESRKPMEMNVDNAVNIARAMIFRLDEIDSDITNATDRLNDADFLSEIAYDVKESSVIKEFCDEYNIQINDEFLQQCIDGVAVFRAFHVGLREKIPCTCKMGSYELHHRLDNVWEKLTGKKHYIPTEATAAAYAFYLEFYMQDWKKSIVQDEPNFILTVDEYFSDLMNRF